MFEIKTCEGCGIEFESTKRRNGPKLKHDYCSQQCRIRIYTDITRRDEVNSALETNQNHIINKYNVGMLRKLGFKVVVESPL